MLAGELLHVTEPQNSSSVHMLPAFDPYVMAHSSRDHLFEATYRSRVSRVAGWISPVVVIDGRVVATWSYAVAKKTLRISVEPFRRLPPKALPEIRARGHELATTLSLADVDVKVL